MSLFFVLSCKLQYIATLIQTFDLWLNLYDSRLDVCNLSTTLQWRALWLTTKHIRSVQLFNFTATEVTEQSVMQFYVCNHIKMQFITLQYPWYTINKQPVNIKQLYAIKLSSAAIKNKILYIKHRPNVQSLYMLNLYQKVTKLKFVHTTHLNNFATAVESCGALGHTPLEFQQ